jgi:hypothetical protein
MILQSVFGDPTVEYIVWLIVGIIILTLMLWLAVRIIVSKSKAKDKKWMILLISVIALIVLPLISGIIGQLLNLIGQLPELLPWGVNYLGALVPIIEFLLFLIIIKFFLSETWGNCVWVALLGLFLLYLLYSFFPVLYSGIGGI